MPPTRDPESPPIPPAWTAFALVGLTLLASFALTMVLSPSHAKGQDRDNPKAWMVRPRTHTDHRGMLKGPFPDGPSVTRACLECHEKEGRDVMHTQHYTWLGREHSVPGKGPAHEHPTRIGKKNLINNFCLSIESNWPRCTSCHAGYGWQDDKFDFSNPVQVDCLVCHEQTGNYKKDLAGLPPAGTDLFAAAESVARPSRNNCGYCHFSGGGGDAVKHGDLDATLSNPPERIDVHMGRLGFACVDCHRSKNHEISGQAMSVSTGEGKRLACTDCHDRTPHRNDRLNAHTSAVACATCHVPMMALETPTKMVWDWSTAGQDTTEKDPHRYLKEKGSFVYAAQVKPEYYWFNGQMERYLKGDPLEPTQALEVNYPRGNVRDKTALIWPFKVHRGKQPYDKRNKYLLVPKTYGDGGYWTKYDWSLALKLGAEATGLPFSGEYDFVATRMYWPLAHMVAPKSHALACTDCHGASGRMDFRALGYDSDPAFSGGRRL